MDNYRLMDQRNIQKIKDALSSNDKIAIAVGKNPSLDEMGAGLGLYLALNNSGKHASIASPSDPLVEISSLVGIDKVKKAFEGEGGDLIVSFPYKEREIQKVSYTLENNHLNIIVKAGPDGLSFTEQDVKYTRTGGTPGLLIIVGTPRVSDLGSLWNPDSLKNTQVVNIDNKVENQNFGDIVIVSPSFSSVSEQIVELLNSLELEIDQDIAQNLLSGISFATNNFQSPKTSASAFEAAGVLMKKGATRQKTFTRPEPQPQFMPQQQDFQRPQPIQRPQFQRQFSQRPQQFPRQPQPRFTQMPRPLSSQQQVPQQPQPQMPPMPINQPQPENTSSDEAPPDWLMPKVYKGSTSV